MYMCMRHMYMYVCINMYNSNMCMHMLYVVHAHEGGRVVEGGQRAAPLWTARMFCYSESRRRHSDVKR